MNHLSILIYLFLFLTIVHSYIFSSRLSKFIVEPLYRNPYQFHSENHIENIRRKRNNGLKLLFAVVFLIAPLYIYRSIFGLGIKSHITLSILMIVMILTSIILLWLNICKIGSSNFGHKFIHLKTEVPTRKQHYSNINPEFPKKKTSVQKTNKGVITSVDFRKETSKNRKSYKKALLKKQNLELLEKFLEHLQNFKHFNRNINQFENLNINIGPNQNKNLSQENICYAILSFFLYEICTNRDYIDTTPQMFYKPFNLIIFNNSERLKRYNYPAFKKKYITDSGIKHFQNSEFYMELLVHYKNSPKM